MTQYPNQSSISVASPIYLARICSANLEIGGSNLTVSTDDPLQGSVVDALLRVQQNAVSLPYKQRAFIIYDNDVSLTPALLRLGLGLVMVMGPFTYYVITFCLFLDPLPPSVIKFGIG